MWRPTLRALGFKPSSKCGSVKNMKADMLRVHRCEFCPPLFPTLPAPSRGSTVQRSVSVQAISDLLREAAAEIGMDHLDLSGKSLRIGGYSAATEGGDDSTADIAAAELRWASKKVPERHYKRKTVSEQRVGGVRQQQALMSAVAEVVAVAPSVMSVRAVAVQCPYKEFPMGLTNVGGVEICRRYQFGVCPRSAAKCSRLHVCHVHGTAHGVCDVASAAVNAWQGQAR
jgi:hypothetical protein